MLRDLDVKNSIKMQKRYGNRQGMAMTDKDYQIRAINNILGNFTREGVAPISASGLGRCPLPRNQAIPILFFRSSIISETM